MAGRLCKNKNNNTASQAALSTQSSTCNKVSPVKSKSRAKQPPAPARAPPPAPAKPEPKAKVKGFKRVNLYALYSRDQFKILKEKDPNMSFKDICKEIAEEYKKLTESELEKLRSDCEIENNKRKAEWDKE